MHARMHVRSTQAHVVSIKMRLASARMHTHRIFEILTAFALQLFVCTAAAEAAAAHESKQQKQMSVTYIVF